MHPRTKRNAYGLVIASPESQDASDAPAWAAELAARRKELSISEKAEAAARLQCEHGWSQAKIGALFGVAGGTVGYWLRTTSDENYIVQRRAEAAYWREQNRYRVTAYSRRWHERVKHGAEARSAMWRAQDGRCYLCERPLGPDRRAIVEHDHRCCPPNKSCPDCQRGLACDACNSIIGLAGDDPDLLETIAKNLRPALAAVTGRLAKRQIA